MFLAPVRSDVCRRKEADFNDSCGGWAEFVDVRPARAACAPPHVV